MNVRDLTYSYTPVIAVYLTLLRIIKCEIFLIILYLYQRAIYNENYC